MKVGRRDQRPRSIAQKKQHQQGPTIRNVWEEPMQNYWTIVSSILSDSRSNRDAFRAVCFRQEHASGKKLSWRAGCTGQQSTEFRL
jgi:hypothetical protein